LAGATKLGEHFLTTSSRFFSGLFINYIDILFIGVEALGDPIKRDPTPQHSHGRKDRFFFVQ
jgi:hypothetical protein